MEEPRRVGRYRLLGRLGRGGMGEVHFARAYGAAGVAKDLCVKLIRTERLDFHGAVGRFVTEARLSMGLHHGNIVAVFDFGRSEEGYYLAMEWVDGADLSALARSGPLPTVIAAHVAAEVARALAYAHGREEPVVHCDVKPANVLVSRAGDVKLADFGTATIAGGGGRSGTPGYMAPEQYAERGVEPRTDAYALGIVLTRTLTSGRDPAAIEDVELRTLALELTRDGVDERPSAAEAANWLEGYVARARAAGAPSPREVLAARVAEVRRKVLPGRDREIEATASFARDGEAILESLSAATTVEPARGPHERTDLPRDRPRSDGHEPSRRATPDAIEPGTVEPGTVEPSTAEPSTAEPSTAEPSTAEPEPRPWLRWAIVAATLATVAALLALGRLPSSAEPSGDVLGAPISSARIPQKSASARRPPSSGAEADTARRLTEVSDGIAPGARPSPRSAEEVGERATHAIHATPVAAATPLGDVEAPSRRVAPAPTKVAVNGRSRAFASTAPRPSRRAAAPPAPSEPTPETSEIAQPIVAAHLSVNAIPWAEVALDGQPLGTTPLFDVSLTPGAHRLVFSNPALGATETRRVEVEAGERRRLVVDLRDVGSDH